MGRRRCSASAELGPRRKPDTIFVVEMPYPATEMSRLPSASAYRRLAEFDEQWLRPACTTLGWELVGSKTEDGSFFLYMYGAGDPMDLVARLSPFDANLGFYDDADPDWLEYATLRELLEQAKAIPNDGEEELAPAKAKASAKAKPVTKVKPAAKAKPTAKAKPVAKAKAEPAAKATAKTPAPKVKSTRGWPASAGARPAAKSTRGLPASAGARPAAKSKPASRKR